MKIIRKIFVLICGLGVMLTINAASKINNKESSGMKVKVSNELNAIMESATIDYCYDEMMSTWLNEFNALQEKGLSSEAADNLASLDAVKTYEACN